jgi:hypothetical protein
MKSVWLKIGLGCLLVTPSLSFAQNVGIGTANPLERLHVAGGLRVNNLSGVGTRMVGADANGTLTLVAPGTNGQVLTQTAGGPIFATPSTGWAILGNAGTAPATHFVGTTDNVDFVTRTNNTEAMRVTNGQRVGIGTATPSVMLEVNSGTGDAIWGRSNSVGAYLGYETNFTFGVAAQTIQGAGVWASNPAAGYTSIYGQSSGSASVAALITYSNVWMAAYNYVDNATNTFNPSVSYSQLNNTGTTLTGTQIAVRGFNNRGTTTGNPGYSVGTQGLANSQSQDSYGVEGLSFSNAPISTGGYFSGSNYAGTNIAYAYVGGWTNGLTARKITGTGTVAEIVPTANHGRVTLICPESPEYWYQDYGTATMVNGFVHVDLDPILSEIIFVDANNPISVFVTPVNMPYFNGVTVMNESATGFDLLELNGGTHSGKIRYQLVCKPKTNFGEGRFAQAPGPGYLKADKEPRSAKAANQPKNVFHWPADHEQYGYDPADHVGIGDFVPAGPHKGKFKMAEGVYVDQIPATKPQ